MSFGQKIIFVILLIFYIIPGIIYYSSTKSKYNKRNNEIDAKIKQLNEEVDKIAVEFNGLKLGILTGLHSSNPMLLIQQIIPEDYLFPPSDAFDCILF